MTFFGAIRPHGASQKNRKKVAHSAQLCEDTLKALAVETLKDMGQLESLNWDDREEAVNVIEERIGRMKQVLKGYFLEVRELGGAEKMEFSAHATEWDEKVRTITSKLTAQKKKWLVIDDNKSNWENSAAGMVQRAQNLQDDIGMSLGRSKKMISESKAAGKATLESLVVQSEALNTVHNNMVTLSERLGQAGTELGTIDKREKIAQYVTMGLCLLICMLMLFIIISWFKNGLPPAAPDSIPVGAAGGPNGTLATPTPPSATP